jgi:uncharacterized protein (DUF362 family)
MMDWFTNPTVAVHRVDPQYPVVAPFHPDTAYPEYAWSTVAASPNAAYRGVREALRLLGLDAAHFGDRAWNPLAQHVTPGATVVLKPNLIRECHLLDPDQWEQIITHGAVVRAVLDYVFLAQQGLGRVIVADGPQTDSDFPAICNRAGLYEIVSFYQEQGLDVSLLDLRRERWLQRGDVIYERLPLPGDPAGYTTVELGEESEFTGYRLSGQFYGADYDIAETRTYHNPQRHAYVLCRTVVDADVVINLPKLKTHKKTGVTISLKNMVGINGYRNCLPHHTLGTPAEHGDEFPTSSAKRRLESRVVHAFKDLLQRLGGRGGGWARGIKRLGRLVFGDTQRVIRSGNWHGNDTAWRMVLDLNKCLFYYDGDGTFRQAPVRYLTLVDGIVAGEGNGPMAPNPVPAGLIVAGWNPLAVDTVCATLIGFDYRRIPLLAAGWRIGHQPLAGFEAAAVRCVSTVSHWNGSMEDLEAEPHLGFEPHFGWHGTIERVARERSLATS